MKQNSFFLLAITFILCSLYFAPKMFVYDYAGSHFVPPLPPVEFSLSSATGRIDRSSLQGKHALVFFGFTNCPEVCPRTMGNISSVLSMLEAKREKVNVLMVSVDPARDTVEVIDKFAKKFGPEFIGAVGSEEELAKMAAGYGVYYEKVSGEPGEELLMHSPYIFLLNPQGEVEVIWGDGIAPAQIASDLNHLPGF